MAECLSALSTGSFSSLIPYAQNRYDLTLLASYPAGDCFGPIAQAVTRLVNGHDATYARKCFISRAATGEILHRYAIEGAEFLNDIAIDARKRVLYITDSKADKVWGMSDGNARLVPLRPVRRCDTSRNGT